MKVSTCIYSQLLAAAFAGHAIACNITHLIPPIENWSLSGYQRIPNVAQYKDADWSQVMGMASNISLDIAKGIADNSDKIAYFFYVKDALCLEKTDGSYRYFSNGDAVFFSGMPCWGKAQGAADGYIKLSSLATQE